jgi:hypothetical protein
MRDASWLSLAAYSSSCEAKLAEIAKIWALQNALAGAMIRLQSEQETTARELDAAKKEWQQRWDQGMEGLRELHRNTEEKLNALIETVDRIIRNRNM